ncbi:MAG: SpaA isopeptide-forming pilin-related protein, partial [Caryophanon sp.]|nr:SpaA isopeptide-forming pilin-related protein [Caryophanon sp.]
FIKVPELPEGSVVIIDGKELPGAEIPIDTQPGTYPVKDKDGKDIGEVTVPETTEENPCPEGTFTPAPPTCEKFEVTVKQGDTPLLEGTKINVVNEAGEKVPGTVNAEGKATFTELPEGKYTVTNEDGSKTYGEFTVDYTVDCEETIVYNPTCELFEITVTVDGNTLVPGTIILLIDENGKKTPTAVDEAGVINLPNLAEGTYTVTNVTEDVVYGTATVDYEIGCQATVVYNTPSAPTCDQFTINVTADGTPLVAGTMIMLTSDAGSRVAQFVGADGTVVFPNLAEGAYTVSNGDTGIVYGNVTVDYTGDCIATVEYVTPPIPACTQFTVTVNADGQPLPAQRPLFFFDVEGTMIASGVTDATGSITLPSTTLIDGTYKVQDGVTNIVYGEVTVAYNEDCAATVNYFTPAPVCEEKFIPVPQLPPGSTVTVDGEKIPVSELPLTTTPGNYTVTDENNKEIGELTVTPGTPENPCPGATFVEKKPPTGSVILTKTDRTDSQKVLVGAGFKLQVNDNGTYVDVVNGLTTNASGQISVTDLPLGEYQFVETQAPEGYTLATEPWKFTITEQQLSAFMIAANDKAPLPSGQLSITKVDAADERIRLIGATFKLVSDDGQVSATATTNQNGQATIIDLPVGNYTLTETQAPEGYVLNDKPIAVQIKTGETFTVVVENTLEEVPPMNGALELMKVDEATDAPLMGAEFTLSDGRINYKVGPTNGNGFAALNDLPPGNYTLTEVKAPTGYVLNTQPMDVTITSNETTSVVIENVKQIVNGELKLTKVDAVTNARLAGAVFQISNGATTVSFETNASGEAVVQNLAAGSYIVTELAAPNGYVLNSVPKVVTIEAGKTNELTFTNTAVVVPPPFGTVQVTKVDATTKGALAGAEFTLHNDQRVYQVGPTNASDIATLQNVQPGVYKLAETKAPAGYVLNRQEMLVNVTANGTAQVIVENVKEVLNGEFKIIKVDNANRALRLAGAKFELSNGVTTITLETNANGEAIARNVAAGNYTVREIVAPTGYVLDSQTTTVQIRANETTELTATNVAQQKVGTFMLVKVDATNANKRLASAAFELSNGVNTYTLITNATGQATVANIPAGTYTLKEVIAPAGYRLNTELVTVTIQDNSTFTFTALNSPSPSGGDIGGGDDPNTDDSGNNNGGNPNPNPGTGGNTGGGGDNSNPGTGGNTGGGGNNSNPGTGGNTGGGGDNSNPGTGGNTGGGGNNSNPGTGGNTGGGGNNSNPGTGGNTGGGGNNS